MAEFVICGCHVREEIEAELDLYREVVDEEVPAINAAASERGVPAIGG